MVAHAGRFLQQVVEYKHKIGFKGAILIEPKPQEPSKHQYDYDAATVHGFLARHGLEGEFHVNLEVNHATLAGHSFQHELAYAAAADLLGSVDANRGDPQNGWDTDQFPTDLYDAVSAMLVVLADGGFKTGGLNFDARVRRESVEGLVLHWTLHQQKWSEGRRCPPTLGSRSKSRIAISKFCRRRWY